MPRVVIISDTHFGAERSAGSPEQLRPLWAEAEELVINGDVAELQDPSRRVRAARLVTRLQELCQADGVRLTLISGNHDPLLTDERHLEFADGAVFVTHGDVLHPAISPWSSSAEDIRRFNVDALGALDEQERTDILGKLSAAQHAAATATSRRRSGFGGGAVRHSLDLARRCAAILYYWHVMPKLAADFAAEHAPHARFFVFGHMHRPGTWTIRGVHVINTGCYGQPRLAPYAVIVDDETVTVRSVHQASDGSYSFGRGQVARWVIADAVGREPAAADRVRLDLGLA